MTRQPAEPLYPVSEVAALWHVSTRHIYDLIARGLLRTVALGARKTRIPESALAEYIDRHSEQAPARGGARVVELSRPPAGPSNPPRPAGPANPGTPPPRPGQPQPGPTPPPRPRLRGVA